MRRLILGAILAALAAAPGARAEAAIAAVKHQQLRWRGVEAHVVRVPAGARVVPVARRPGRTVPAFARAEGAIAAINGGYFNHSDGQPVSHVVRDGRALNDPRANRALLDNPVLRSVLPRIFDQRVEWRALSGAGGTRWTFAPHAAPPPPGWAVTHALQAGPRLLPGRDLEAEGFVIRNAQGAVVRDGIASAVPAARSALGLTPEGTLLMVAVAGSSKAARGLSLAALAELMGHLGASEAINLDGGGSTTLSWKDGAGLRTFVGTGQRPALVHAALLVTP